MVFIVAFLILFAIVLVSVLIIDLVMRVLMHRQNQLFVRSGPRTLVAIDASGSMEDLGVLLEQFSFADEVVGFNLDRVFNLREGPTIGSGGSGLNTLRKYTRFEGFDTVFVVSDWFVADDPDPEWICIKV